MKRLDDWFNKIPFGRERKVPLNLIILLVNNRNKLSKYFISNKNKSYWDIKLTLKEQLKNLIKPLALLLSTY